MVEGRTVTTDELFAIARTEALKQRRAKVESATGGTSYRCMGAILYILQRAGFGDVSFDDASSGKQ